MPINRTSLTHAASSNSHIEDTATTSQTPTRSSLPGSQTSYDKPAAILDGLSARSPERLPTSATNRRIAEPASHHVAEAAQVVQVLNFFQGHSRPAQAFDEAMRQFGMSRLGLLQLLRRAGVAEPEALSGALPPASQRWQRILQTLGGQPASASAQVPTPPHEPDHAVANSLKRELDASSPLHEAGPALASRRRNRSRLNDSVNRSSQELAETKVPESLRER